MERYYEFQSNLQSLFRKKWFELVALGEEAAAASNKNAGLKALEKSGRTSSVITNMAKGDDKLSRKAEEQAIKVKGTPQKSTKNDDPYQLTLAYFLRYPQSFATG